MTRLIIILTLLLSALPAFANSDSLSTKAAEAYANDNFIEALKLYQQIQEDEGVSSDLYFNIGNTYYRLGNKGKAILFYEKALALNPSNTDARENLQFVNTKIVDNTIVDEANIIVIFFRKAGNLMTSDSWAITAITFFILFIAAVALYIFASSVTARKIGFFGGMALFVFVIIANVYAFSSKNRMLDHSYAIITSSSVTLSTSPRTPKDKSEEAFILNEGTKVSIIDSVDTKNNGRIERWYDIKADDTHRAWIKSDNLEKI